MRVFSVHYNHHKFLKFDVAYNELRYEDKIIFGKPLISFANNKCVKCLSPNNIKKIVECQNQ